MRKKGTATAINAFRYNVGQRLGKNYEILGQLGSGWEGETYRIREVATGIERAAKLFFPHRNKGNKTAKIYARKLHRLRDCPVVIRYMHQEVILHRNQPITVFISEFIEGERLSSYLASMPSKRLQVFQGLHLLYSLTKGVEGIHFLDEYHGDLHPGNIIVNRRGLTYELKLLDFFHWGCASKANKKEDLCDAIRIFYDAIGGKRWYSRHPAEVKEICCGLNRSLIYKKFRSISDLRVKLETLSWT